MSNREKILESAIKIFLEFGFNGASVAKIVKGSGLSNGTVFHYFKNKDELINSAYFYAKVTIATYIQENMDFSESHKNTLFSYWKSYIKWGYENKELMRFFINFSGSTNIKSSTVEEASKHFDFFAEVFRNAVEDGAIIYEDINYLMIYTMGAANSTITFLNIMPDKYTDEFLESSFKMYWRSVVNI